MNDKKENQTAKIGISQKAEAALDQMVREANEGFLGGRITKHQLASWVMENFAERHFEGAKEAIRQALFDKTAFLTAIASKMRSAARNGEDTSALEAELMAALTGARGKVPRDPKRRQGRPGKAKDQGVIPDLSRQSNP